MIKLLNLENILIVYQRVIDQSGGSKGVRDQGILESALAQPYMTYAEQELYPTLIEKAAALGFSLINNPPLLMAINVLDMLQ